MIEKCPECGVEMSKEDNGYAYLWSCRNHSCGNMGGGYSIYDEKKFKEVIVKNKSPEFSL